MKKLNYPLLAIIISLHACNNEQEHASSAGWQLQPTPVVTQWAKDVSPTNALTEYPRPQMVRSNWQNLNGLWEYAITDSNVTAPQYQGSILVPFPVESALSGVQKPLLPKQRLWYRRTFEKPDLNKDERVLLHFGAVDWQAIVFVNNKQIGSHSGGYQNFSFDITDALNEEDNELVVKVYDPTENGPNPHGKQVLRPGGITYTASSGIWQTVWLETVPAVSIASLTITPNVDSGYISLGVQANGDANNYSIEAIIQSNDQIITKKQFPVSTTQLAVPNPRLWSPDDPYLYDLTVRLLLDGKEVDAVNSYFGMRKIEIKKDEKGRERIYLNNKYTYNLGTLDQGFWPDGLYTAPTDEALAFDVKAIKAMGFNTIRKHIKIEPARWYYHCDKTGVMVWQDMVQPGERPEGKAAFESESATTLQQLHNYPSITCWVLFNEGWGAYDQKRLTEWIKKTDPSRIVSGHTGEYINENKLDPAANNWVSSDIVDIHAYPEPMMPPVLPGKASVIGEYGGVGVSITGHQWNDLTGWGYVQASPGGLTAKYESMIDTLKKLEQLGLTGSIYTQPFDVEGEENGLLTYDRVIIKIPIEKLRSIHQKLIPITSGFAFDPKELSFQLADTSEHYSSLVQQYKAGKRDSFFLRHLAMQAVRQQDTPIAISASADYMDQVKNKYAKNNIRFIDRFTNSSKDKGFALFLQSPDQINQAIEPNYAQLKVLHMLQQEEIHPVLSNKAMKPDWNAIDQNLQKKYGKSGQEAALWSKINYCREHKDWEPFTESVSSYIQQFGLRGQYQFFNDCAREIFLHISDSKAIQEALAWSQQVVREGGDNPQTLDTNANLLYKSGNKEDAIKMQEKAVALNSQDKALQETLNKMKNGQKTW